MVITLLCSRLLKYFFFQFTGLAQITVIKKVELAQGGCACDRFSAVVLSTVTNGKGATVKPNIIFILGLLFLDQIFPKTALFGIFTVVTCPFGETEL